MKQATLHLLRSTIATLLLTLPATLRAQEAKPAPPPPQTHALQSTLIVIGFAGGFIKRTSAIHGEVATSPSTFARNTAPASTPRSLRTTVAKKPTREDPPTPRRKSRRANSCPHEKNCHPSAESGGPAFAFNSLLQPRIILYGHSWGASEAVSEARRLQRDNIPVLLLITVDSVPRSAPKTTPSSPPT